MASEFDFFFSPAIDGSTPQAGNTFEPDAGNSVFSVAYYRDKIEQFQNVLFGLDRSARIAYQMRDDPTLDAVTFARVNEWIANYEGKRAALRAAAVAVNGAVQAANFFGADLPTITRPTTLGALPAYTIPAAILAGAAVLVSWGLAAISAMRAIILERARTADLTPEQRATLESQRIEVESASQQAQSSPLSSVSTVVKWVAIGAAVIAVVGLIKGMRDR